MSETEDLFATYPTECVLCDESADTHEDLERHMEEVHAC